MNMSHVLTVVTAAVLACWVGAAIAHTQLSSSSPADQSVLDAPPADVALTFSEPVRLTAVAVESDRDRHSLEVDVADPAKDFVIALPQLTPGQYVIEWRALSEDTHVMTGQIRFTVSS